MSSVYRWSLWLLCLSFCALQSCRRATIPTSTETEEVAVQEFDFDSFQGRGRLVYTHANRTLSNISLAIRAKKDSVIWVNFSSFGIPGARVRIKRDSIAIINFIDKSYSVFGYARLSKRVGFTVDYFMIQALLMGNSIMPQDPDQKSVVYNTDHTVIKRFTDSLTVITRVFNKIQKIDRITLHKRHSEDSLHVEYAHFEPVEDQVIPKKNTWVLRHDANGTLNTYTVAITYSTIKMNGGNLAFPFQIPKRYVRQ